MEGKNITFPKRYAPKLESRRMGVRSFVTAAYKEDGDTPEAQLLTKIKSEVEDLIKTRGYANATEVTTAVNKQLEGLDIEALRTFNAQNVETNIRNIAAEVEKLKNAPVGGNGQKRNFLKEALDANFEKIEMVMRSKGQNRNIIEFNIRAAAVMTSTNVVDDGTIPDNILESFTLGEFVPKRYGTQYIWDVADRQTMAEIEEYITWLEEGSTQGAFAEVSEGGLKPLVSTGLVRNYAQSKKVAGKHIVTEEVTKFRQKAYAIIQRLIQDKLIRDYSAVVTTDLQAQAAGYVGTILDGTIVAPNDYDAIGAVCAQIESLNFFPDVIVLNPQDKWRIRLEKDSQGRYLFPVVTQDGQEIIFALRMVTSTYQAAGTFTIGESGLFKIDEEPVTIRMGYGITVTTSAGNVTDVVSDLDNNQFRVIAEMFFRDYIATNNIGSFVTTTFATVKTALTKV